MSGICGIIHFDGAPVDADLLKKMTEASAHRGRDGIYYWIHGNVGLAYLAMYSTPESVREWQPLFNSRRDRVLVADARIDNRPELIQTLHDREVLQDKDPTDADLILAAYKYWGEACAEQIIGDFAFVIWDIPGQKLFCARDPFGIRLLYYNFDGCTFRFATDIDQIMADEHVSRNLDGFAFSDFITINRREHARTLFAAVQSVWPGRCIVVERGQARGWRYWNPDRNPPIHCKTEDEYIQVYRQLLFRAVSDRLRSQKKKIALMVSGGLDSSSIAAIAQHLYTSGQTATQPLAFTNIIEYPTECNESEFSSLLAKETGIELHVLPNVLESRLQQQQPFCPPMNTPAAGQSEIQQGLFEPISSHNCDLVMTGDGGDLLFTPAQVQPHDHIRSLRWRQAWPWMLAYRQQGQTWPEILRIFFFWPFLPPRFKFWLEHKLTTLRSGYIPAWVQPGLIRQAHTYERLFQQSYPCRFPEKARQYQYEVYISKIIQAPATTIYQTLAPKAGLGAAYPLLDRRLMDFLISIPLHLQARPGMENTRWILRQAMSGILPEKIRQRQGKTFGTAYFAQVYQPFQDWLVSQMDRMLLDQKGLIYGTIMRDEFIALLAKGPKNILPILTFRMLYLEAWVRMYASGNSTVLFNSLESWQFE